ncbi:MAG TPA: DUF2807 domain-containing protein [Bacteroidia bacterium]|nr:DUF2807 domain-containing protein [Bacteroidia bacterium]
MTWKYCLLLLLVSFFFNSCKKENLCDCIKRTGTIIQETRDISGFDAILVKDDVNVFLIQDSISKVIVEAGENIVPLIKTQVSGKTLVLRNRNRCNFMRSYKKPLNVYIHIPLLTQINAEGTGDIKSLNTIVTPAIYVAANNSGNTEITLQATQLTTSMHGNADFTLHGYSYHHDCDVQGTAYLLAGDLQTDYTYLHSATLGLCYVNVTSLFQCKIDLKGDIFCYGNPKHVDYEYSNTGRLYLQ